MPAMPLFSGAQNAGQRLKPPGCRRWVAGAPGGKSTRQRFRCRPGASPKAVEPVLEARRRPDSGCAQMLLEAPVLECSGSDETGSLLPDYCCFRETVASGCRF